MKTLRAERMVFLDNVRSLMIVLVVMHHAAAAYTAVAPHWGVHDTTTVAADVIRELFDVFMMPVLFFAAGYFVLPSLEKKGAWAFLKERARRLLVPWVLAVLIVLPLALYDQPAKPITPFRSYWLSYLGSFQVRLRPTQVPVGPTTQAVYWFVSLLFAFSAVAALIYALARRRNGTFLGAGRPAASSRSVLVALAAFGLLTSAGHFLLLLFVPDSSWFTLYMLLEFQVTRLVPYAGCFALGIYAQSRGWLAGGKPLGSLALWGALSAGLAAAYLVLGQPLFGTGAATAGASVGLLLAFAFVRSFLVVALLVVFVSFGAGYWNWPSALGKRLAAASYNIYLVHFLILVVLQTGLVAWVGGPALVKMAIVFVAGLAVSYALSRWVLERHSRAFAAVILALFVFCLAVRP